MTDKVLQWRNLRNELDDLLKARNMKYAEAVKEYYRENPKDASEKKSSSKKFSVKSDYDEFSYDNCVEKKYWKKRPKNETASELLKDRPAPNRLEPAIAFLEKLKLFLAAKDCQKPEQWISEKFGQDFLNSFRKEVIEPIKQEKENQLFSGIKDKNGKDEFDF
ncbi:hypothetical protein B7990_00465 [Fibrobacter sp. UWB4]|uniref:hypothetical protein n=1 Tax=Fibrobacter sp. UWB4 TaxID=1964356 RepID=UPI000B52170A|nr:hypothetical protein [Fibrobacter sp. UWB4]OWV19684.1 hypothetical protein B7990_00465 [Fibrobacter sp. UWB4]